MNATTYKGLTVGQKMITKVDYYDYKQLVKQGTEFTIKSFPPYPMKQGSFIFGVTENGLNVRLAFNEVKKV